MAAKQDKCWVLSKRKPSDILIYDFRCLQEEAYPQGTFLARENVVQERTETKHGLLLTLDLKSKPRNG